MRAVEVSGYGPPDVLRMVDVPDPEPVAGRVRVAVAASTASPVDTLLRAGAFTAFTPGVRPPFVLGWDFAGTLIDPTDDLPSGSRVCGLHQWILEATAAAAGQDGGAVSGSRTGSGSNAEVLIADPAWLVPLPEDVGFEKAAAVPLNGLAAAGAVALAGGVAGSVVLVSGASGSLGGFAVQLAAGAGARVIALGSPVEDEEYVRGLGASEYLPRAEDPSDVVSAVRSLVPHGVDAVIDAASLGGPLLGAVRDGGAFVALIETAQPTAERGIRTELAYSPADRTLLADLVHGVASGSLRPRIADVLPLAATVDAHRRLEAGGVRGRLVLAIR